MAEDHDTVGTILVHAWRQPDGRLRARVTYAVVDGDPPLEVISASSKAEVVALVAGWLERIRLD